ncbi:MAG: hypothetical protein KF769_13630 [Parvibaculum sp.]|nr:hypothetical protein [Parvibaculum sp.]
MRVGLGAVLLVLTAGLTGSALAQHHGPTPTPPVPKQPTAPVQQQLQQKQIERNLPDGFARPTVAVPQQPAPATSAMPPLWPTGYHERGTAVQALNELMKQQSGDTKPTYLSVTATNGAFLVTKKYTAPAGDRWEITFWVSAGELGIDYPQNAEGWSAEWDNSSGKLGWPYDDAGRGVGTLDLTVDQPRSEPAREPVRPQEDFSHIPVDEIPHDLREGLGLNLPAHDQAAIDYSKGLAMRDEERAAQTRDLAHQIANIGLEAGIFVTSTALPVAGAIIGGGRGFANAYLAALEGGASESEALMRGFGAAGVNVAINLTGGKLAEALKSNPLLAQSIGQLTERARALVALNIDAASNLIGNFAESGLYALGEIAGEPRPDAWRYEQPFPPGQQYQLEQ